MYLCSFSLAAINSVVCSRNLGISFVSVYLHVGVRFGHNFRFSFSLPASVHVSK